MLINPIIFLLIGLLIFILSLPLIYRKIPMNSLYGFRIKAAFESEQRWYDINAYAGRQMAIWSLLIIIVGVIGFFVPNEHEKTYMFISVAAMLLAVIMPLLFVLRWIRWRDK